MLMWNIICISLILIFTQLSCTDSLVFVEPYEMENFSKDRMNFTALPNRESYSNHTFAIREASSGGESGVQGGCGCK